MLAPDDGVLDGPGESFTIRLGVLAPGQHTITVRVQDEGDNVGRITQGYLGDFVVLSDDLFTQNDPMEIVNAQVDLTVVGGEVVYER